jgi:hypothetical protein
MYYGVPLFTRANVSGITGQSKTRKTGLATILVRALLNDPVLRDSGFTNKSKGKIIWFDSEMSPHSIQKVATAIQDNVPKADYERITFIATKSKSVNERLLYIEAVLNYLIDTGEKIDFVVLDGLKDMLHNINDQAEASDIMSRINIIVDTYDLHLITVLHSNKGTSVLRGAIGSELMNKAELIFLNTASNEDTKVSCERSRDKAFGTFWIGHDVNGVVQKKGGGTPVKATPTNANENKILEVAIALYEQLEPNLNGAMSAGEFDKHTKERCCTLSAGGGALSRTETTNLRKRFLELGYIIDKNAPKGGKAAIVFDVDKLLKGRVKE